MGSGVDSFHCDLHGALFLCCVCWNRKLERSPFWASLGFFRFVCLAVFKGNHDSEKQRSLSLEKQWICCFEYRSSSLDSLNVLLNEFSGCRLSWESFGGTSEVRKIVDAFRFGSLSCDFSKVTACCKSLRENGECQAPCRRWFFCRCSLR